MLNIARIKKSNRQIKALTGMNTHEFALLVSEIEKILYEAAAKKTRKRAVGGGRKGALKSSESKTFFILFYLKVYPTYDLAAAIFDVDKSRVSRWVKQLLPILETVLGRSCVLPKRKVQSAEELFEHFPETKDLFVDGLERRTQRSTKPKQQRRQYSGKKKCHTRKNIVVADEQKRILYLSASKNGKIHDFKQVQKTELLDNIPPDTTVWVDKGFQGIKNKVPPEQVQIPHKKPKGGNLTSEQKEENKIISSIRIIVEHAIGGIKRFGCMSQIYRNRRGQDDQMISICSGLWNFHIQNA